jgi:hypothetical protein
MESSVVFRKREKESECGSSAMKWYYCRRERERGCCSTGMNSMLACISVLRQVLPIFCVVCRFNGAKFYVFLKGEMRGHRAADKQQYAYWRVELLSMNGLACVALRL